MTASMPLTPDDINDRAWKQMVALTDDEIIIHPLLADYVLEDGDGIWDLRIALRDKFFNELWAEMKAYAREEPDDETDC